MIRNHEMPPNWKKIKAFFKLHYGVVFAYFPDIYNPDGVPVSYPLEAHENVHLRQQEAFGVEKWWDMYCLNPDFRLSQEVLAHQEQFREAKRFIKDRNKLFRYLDGMARELSSELYGNIITPSEAMRAIESETPIEFDLHKK